MASTAAPEEGAPPKTSKRPLLISLAIAVLAGGGGFFVSYAGLLPFGKGDAPASAHDSKAAPVAFVPVTPIVISLGPSGGGRLLRFGAQLEVAKTDEAEVTHLMPRVLDVMNSYLRAVEVRDLEDSSALVKIRSHLLYRVQLVAGENRIRDLLITEFVLN